MTTAYANTPADWSARAAEPRPHIACGWSEEGQFHRMMAVSKHLNVTEDQTVLDYGCGTGELAKWLPRTAGYYAHDWADGMLDRVAREQPHARIVRVLPDALFDHVVCCGPFNLAANWSREQTWETIGGLWLNNTRRTLIASLYRGDDPQCISYNAAEVAYFAERIGCGRFVVDGSYRQNDTLLVMRR